MAELLGGALLSSFISVLFERIATPEFLDLFKTQQMNKAVLKELQSLLHVVNGVLDDAEERQLASPNLEVQKFLDDLRDAAYEADDLLDDINYQVTAATIQAEDSRIATASSANQSWNNCCLHNPFKKFSKKRESFPPDVPGRIEKIVERLHSLVDLSSKLELKSTTSRRKEVSPPRETSSLVEQSDIIGRDAEMNDILNSLKDDRATIGVVPIVGMGGIGKTTMAQLVFNDSRVQEMFECRAWVCISDNYDMLKIKKELLNQVNDLVRNDDMNLDQIDRKLQESLKAKKYLLVLDDLWNEDYGDWEALMTPLNSGADGSKIIITTRNQRIAANLETAKSHQLGELDVDSCWLLFANRAFKDEEGDRKFQTIGKEIVRKCRGLPLAAKMLGGLLRGRKEMARWEEVRDSNIWELSNNNPLAALRLSYQHLPSYLKQCFAYCAIFPKDYRMKKEQIVQLWMAEGFLAFRGKKMQEVGSECFDELVSRSFFQESRKYGEPCFLMHDLINDLAKLICGEFLIRMDDDNSCEFSVRNRYFSFVRSKANSCKTLILDGTCKAQFLRSLLSCCGYDREVDDAVVNDLLSHLRCLRVLSLQNSLAVENLPKAIGNLKHMRYLDLAKTSVKRLPESVCTLYNLQTVILWRCNELVELPRGFGNLINLHCLDIRETPNLQEMPPKMGNLKDLRILNKFSVGKQNSSNINELIELQHLCGKLHISNLQNVVGTIKDILKNKMHLEHLELEWSGETEDSEHDKSVLKGLKPYRSIIALSITGYGGKNFPDWIGHSFYTNIVFLKLTDCKNCTNFPPLEQLSSLEDLSISKFDGVEEVSMKMSLTSLKRLHIRDMKRWQKWVFGEENDGEKRGSLVKLEELRIENCPELKCISRCGPTHMIFESLIRLNIEGCSPFLNVISLLATINFKQLVLKNKPPIPLSHNYSESTMVKLEKLPSAMYGLSISKLRVEGLEETGNVWNALEDVEVKESKSVECIPLEMFPALKSLYVYRCNKLKSLSACGEPLPHPLTSLTSLEMISCKKLTCFPKGGISAPNLTNLQLSRCSSLKSLPEDMHGLLPSLEILCIKYCKELESFSEGSLPTKLQSLEILNCNDKVISGMLQWDLQTLDVLSHLSLGGYEGDDLEFFPQETLLLPPSLTSLEISDFENLKFINCGAIQHLANLSISGCPNLKSLVRGGLTSSVSVESFQEFGNESSLGGGNLQSLEIYDCNKLICSRLQWGLQRFNTLSHLSLWRYEGDDLDSFPEVSLLPSTLTSLKIWHFKNLQGINYKGLQHLASLSQLEISYCPNLQCLPEQGLPSSLSLLYISNCPLLEKRCKREIGEDWPKISHISTIEIN